MGPHTRARVHVCVCVCVCVYVYYIYKRTFTILAQGESDPGCGIDNPPPSSAKVKERVELYIHSPSGSSWLVLG